MAYEMTHDILRARQPADDVRRSKARYWGIFRTSPQGKLLVANTAPAKILGYDSAADLWDEFISKRRICLPAAVASAG